MAMGLVGASYCDFVVYTLKSLLVIRIKFDELFFTEVTQKLNNFYKNFLLPKIMDSHPLSEDEVLSS